MLLIITTAVCITPDEKPIEETGADIDDRNMQRSYMDERQGIGLRDDDGDGIPDKDDPDFRRGVDRRNNIVNTQIDDIVGDGAMAKVPNRRDCAYLNDR